MVPGRRGQTTSASPPQLVGSSTSKHEISKALKAGLQRVLLSLHSIAHLPSSSQQNTTFTLTTPSMTTPFFRPFNPSSSTSQVPFDIASVMQGLAHSDLPSMINDILGNLASAAQPPPQGEASADASASKAEGPVLTKTMIPRYVRSSPSSAHTR